MSNKVPRKTPRQIFASLFILFFSSTFITPDSSARDGTANSLYVQAGSPETVIASDFAGQFVRQGKECYQQGDIQGAIDYFARVLLLDRANKTARESMILMSARSSLPAVQRIQLFLSEDLLVFNEKLGKQLIFLAARRDALTASLIQQNYPQTLIDQKFQAIRDRSFFSTENRGAGVSSASTLEVLNKSLITEKERLSRELVCVREQLVWLRPIGSLWEEEPQNPDTHVSRPPRLDDPGEAWQQIAGVREELSELRKQVEALQQDVKHKDDKITALTKQVVEFALKLTEREMILSEKINALGSLHEAYAELQSRQELSKFLTELGQKILEEKNVQIQSLQEGLAALQADTARHTTEINGLIAAKDQALEQWEKILAIYQVKLKDAARTVNAGNEDIATLQEQLARVRTKLFEKETALEKTKEKLVSLEKQFQSVVSDPK